MGIFSKKQKDTYPNVVESVATTMEKVEANTKASVAVEFNDEHTTHFSPVSYDETKNIADTLIRFKEIMVNFTKVETKEDKKRIIDFLTGIMYALEGDYKKVDKGIYYFYIRKNNF